MRVLITGADGQLGYELQRAWPETIEPFCADINTLDITSEASVREYFKEHKPHAVINAAAYTAVDKAETETEQAYAVNAQGPGILAQACADAGIPMVQVSTDFVFDGTQSTSYLPEDEPCPLGIYGESKWQGECAVQKILGNRAAIIRTAWVYSAHGNNFVKTMLRLMAEKAQLGIVADQIGTPTWANSLAKACWNACLNLIANKDGGIFHWTDAGACSWYDFAVAIQDEALALGLLNKPIPVNPIPAQAYPTPAKRPSFSVLDKTSAYEQLDMSTTHWRHNLRAMLEELKELN